MSNPDGQTQLNDVIHHIADLLLGAIDSDTDGRAWKKGCLDVRGSATGSSRLVKWRVELTDGEMLNELDAPVKASLLTQAFDIRDKEFPDKKWYGLLITVYPDKQWQVEFNYDPQCVKGFFDS
jgi:hypothetical protein